MKTVQYDLRIIHRKKVAIGALTGKKLTDSAGYDHVRRGSEHGRRRSGRHCG